MKLSEVAKGTKTKKKITFLTEVILDEINHRQERVQNLKSHVNEELGCLFASMVYKGK